MSTRSNLYNHPTQIREGPARIRLDKRGLPANVLQTHALARSKMGAVPESSAADEADGASGDDGGSDDDGGDDEDGSDAPRENKGVARARDETPEDRKARKQAVKEERRARRAGKKSTKSAFKAEEQRQHEQQLRLGRNPSGVRL